ncbi:MAG: ABC transporter ATP-binding protein [Anaerolineales bacterium]|nr:ABC transporter ATP-binding protein [Anaerolineales bacterium]
MAKRAASRMSRSASKRVKSSAYWTERCRKSTTIRLLLSLIHPTSGSGKVFGKDVVTRVRKSAAILATCHQRSITTEGMKVIDLLKYSASFYEGDLPNMHELSEIMELEMNRRISDLSYGNKKKVGIVQGLLHSPKLLFLDEPTLDSIRLTQRKFFELIRAENARGVTVFFSSHILGSAADVQPGGHHPRGQDRRNLLIFAPCSRTTTKSACDSGWAESGILQYARGHHIADGKQHGELLQRRYQRSVTKISSIQVADGPLKSRLWKRSSCTTVNRRRL